jgi:hypothetical protein
MPWTGSYYGFLTLVSTDGTEIMYEQLERNYAMFNDLKKWAKEFVKTHSVKIYSADPIVSHSLKVVRDERQQTENFKDGVVDRISKVALGVVEA